MNQIEAFEEIDAPPDVVWDVLLEFDGYPALNPFARAVGGTLRGDGSRRLRTEPSDRHETAFGPTIVRAEPERRLVWRDRLAVPFAFDGYREVRLEPTEDGQTLLLHRETDRGALVPLLFDRDALERRFAATNAAVRDRAERRIAAVA
ncbi:Polyketide cyclase/dehydrase [Haloterrigena turkmenica DSM 5511]|uniref:Polyketide cyclase/dehydrase n=1 Tax=Haloterrigena turkmenica (strain ATCC 51198 / DSM 5511 / JCM 9101 / NCIMB 13204 / VKM B-1734 / 4k) TaxID=543526 RepID=D2RWN9_HALTV|nr:SRPBCC domain-containing protein [Haloterrigena turkmenica]ADB61540.1 Polyketide cyclase/dehydrase [Haloterrigena turkmenica DSM 5511]